MDKKTVKLFDSELKVMDGGGCTGKVCGRGSYERGGLE